MDNTPQPEGAPPQHRPNGIPAEGAHRSPSLQPRESAAGAAVATVLAWLVILLVVIAVAIIVNVGPAPGGEHEDEAIGLQLMRMQSRFLVGNGHLTSSTSAMYGQAQNLNMGPIPQRLRFVVLAGELMGPEEALSVLDELVAKVRATPSVEFTETEREIVRALRVLYADYEAGRLDALSLSEQQRNLLRDELDWFGTLALHPAGGPDEDTRREIIGSAVRTALMLLLAAVSGVLVGFAGFVGLVCVVVLTFIGRIGSRVGGFLPDAHIYLETFAIWLLLFFMLNIALLLVPVPESQSLLVSALAFFLSMSALLWMRVRGVPWARSRREIGWVRPPWGAAEPVVGAGCYGMTLPILMIGILLTLLLMSVANFLQGAAPDEEFSPTGGPAHPIILAVGDAGVWGIIQVYLVAAVAAPIVEETMFRGVLYRYLRSMTSRTALGISIFLSAVLNSLIFAMVHPQGWIALPVLVALGFSMSLAREWRGSLVAPITVHAINNAIAMTMLLVVLGR